MKYMEISEIAAHIEALLFTEGAAVTRKKIIDWLSLSHEQLELALTFLHGQNVGRGITIVETATELSLVVSEISSEVVRKVLSLDTEKEIGEAGLEVLAILLYKGPSTRSGIDYIRGVNTSTTVRALLSRGLIIRAGNPHDGREYVYEVSSELLAHLGVTSQSALPEYAILSAELASFAASLKAAGNAFENNGEPTSH
jgi:segregation and condensation protein B